MSYPHSQRVDVFTRQELYDLVWSKPVTHIAKSFGISDVAIKKTCKKHDVPTPWLGYWAKVAHGKKVKKTPLPKLKKGIQDRIQIYARQVKPIPRSVEEAERKFTETNRKNVELTERQHQIVARIVERASNRLQRAKPDRDGFVNCHVNGLPSIDVGPSSIDRCTILLASFFKLALAKGFEIDRKGETLGVIVDGEPFSFRIYEGKGKIRHEPTPSELKEQAKLEEKAKRYSWYRDRNTQTWRTWDHPPSGRLSLEIIEPSEGKWGQDRVVGRWYSRKTKQVEDYLEAMMLSLVAGAAGTKHRRAEKEENQRQKILEEDRRQQEREAAGRRKARMVLMDDLSVLAADVNVLQQLKCKLIENETCTEGLDTSITLFLDELQNRIDAAHSRLTLEHVQSVISKRGLVDPVDILPCSD